MRVLAVDPGEKRMGIALSDPTGVVANPLGVIQHVARLVDAAQVVEMAEAHRVELIIVGQSLDEEGQPTFEGRRAARFAAALRSQTDIPVSLWDESFSTRDARAARIAMGVVRKKRAGHLDDLAAVIILQSYLDAQIHE